MGKHIVRFSRWSGRSLFLVYSRLMTLVFALFCAATGQLQKTTSTKATVTTFKGTALQASDSTVLKNVKLFLNNCLAPLYGIMPEYGVIAPWYGTNMPIILPDTVRTDANGNFEIKLIGTGTLIRSISSEQITEPSGRTGYYYSDCVSIKEGTDSTYTLYFSRITTASKPAVSRTAQHPVITALSGQELKISIPETRGHKSEAIIVNSNGQKLTTLSTDAEGALRWDTRSVVKGVYFLQLIDTKNNPSVQILVK